MIELLEKKKNIRGWLGKSGSKPQTMSESHPNHFQSSGSYQENFFITISLFSTEILTCYMKSRQKWEHIFLYTNLCLFIVSKCKCCSFSIFLFAITRSGPLVVLTWSPYYFSMEFSVLFSSFFVSFPVQYCRWSCHTHLSLINVHL